MQQPFGVKSLASLFPNCVTLLDYLKSEPLFPKRKMRDSNNFPLNISVMKLGELIHLKYITVPDRVVINKLPFL